MKGLTELVVLIRGGGEVASGVAHKLHQSHLRVCLTEIEEPLAVCRGVAFSEAVFDGSKTIMGVTAEHAPATSEEIRRVWQRGNIPIIIDPEALIRKELKPDVLVDALMVKRNTGTGIADASLVIGLGPGFYAGRDVHVVIETSHEQDLGRVISNGEAGENTGIPVEVGGLTRERVVWAPWPGIFTTDMGIGDSVASQQVVGWIDGQPVSAPVSGMLRGLLRSGVRVTKGSKLIEVDPVNEREICGFIADKIRRIADGVLEAIRMKL